MRAHTARSPPSPLPAEERVRRGHGDRGPEEDPPAVPVSRSYFTTGVSALFEMATSRIHRARSQVKVLMDEGVIPPAPR